MRMRRLLPAALAVSVLCGLPGCGGSKDDRPAAGGGAGPTSWEAPKDLLKALHDALAAGDSARVASLYDASDPAAATKKRFWAALGESIGVGRRVQAAYTQKFGQAAWESDDNPARGGARFSNFVSILANELAGARVDEEDGAARVGVDKLIFKVVRKEGRFVAFREETFGNGDVDVRMAEDDLAEAKRILAAVEAASDPADSKRRVEEIRAH